MLETWRRYVIQKYKRIKSQYLFNSIPTNIENMTKSLIVKFNIVKNVITLEKNL